MTIELENEMSMEAQAELQASAISMVEAEHVFNNWKDQLMAQRDTSGCGRHEAEVDEEAELHEEAEVDEEMDDEETVATDDEAESEVEAKSALEIALGDEEASSGTPMRLLRAVAKAAVPKPSIAACLTMNLDLTQIGAPGVTLIISIRGEIGFDVCYECFSWQLNAGLGFFWSLRVPGLGGLAIGYKVEGSLYLEELPCNKASDSSYCRFLHIFLPLETQQLGSVMEKCNSESPFESFVAFVKSMWRKVEDAVKKNQNKHVNALEADLMKMGNALSLYTSFYDTQKKTSGQKKRILAATCRWADGLKTLGDVFDKSDPFCQLEIASDGQSVDQNLANWEAPLVDGGENGAVRKYTDEDCTWVQTRTECTPSRFFCRAKPDTGGLLGYQCVSTQNKGKGGEIWRSSYHSDTSHPNWNEGYGFKLPEKSWTENVDVFATIYEYNAARNAQLIGESTAKTQVPKKIEDARDVAKAVEAYSPKKTEDGDDYVQMCSGDTREFSLSCTEDAKVSFSLETVSTPPAYMTFFITADDLPQPLIQPIRFQHPRPSPQMALRRGRHKIVLRAHMPGKAEQAKPGGIAETVASIETAGKAAKATVAKGAVAVAGAVRKGVLGVGKALKKPFTRAKVQQQQTVKPANITSTRQQPAGKPKARAAPPTSERCVFIQSLRVASEGICKFPHREVMPLDKGGKNAKVIVELEWLDLETGRAEVGGYRKPLDAMTAAVESFTGKFVDYGEQLLERVTYTEDDDDDTEAYVDYRKLSGRFMARYKDSKQRGLMKASGKASKAGFPKFPPKCELAAGNCNCAVYCEKVGGTCRYKDAPFLQCLPCNKVKKEEEQLCKKCKEANLCYNSATQDCEAHKFDCSHGIPGEKVTDGDKDAKERCNEKARDEGVKALELNAKKERRKFNPMRKINNVFANLEEEARKMAYAAGGYPCGKIIHNKWPDERVLDFARALQEHKESEVIQKDMAFYAEFVTSAANLFIRSVADLQAMFNIYFTGEPDFDGDCLTVSPAFNNMYEFSETSWDQAFGTFSEPSPDWITHRVATVSTATGRLRSEITLTGMQGDKEPNNPWCERPWASGSRLQSERQSFAHPDAPKGKTGHRTDPRKLNGKMYPQFWCEAIEAFIETNVGKEHMKDARSNLEIALGQKVDFDAGWDFSFMSTCQQLDFVERKTRKGRDESYFAVNRRYDCEKVLLTKHFIAFFPSLMKRVWELYGEIGVHLEDALMCVGRINTREFPTQRTRNVRALNRARSFNKKSLRDDGLKHEGRRPRRMGMGPEESELCEVSIQRMLSERKASGKQKLEKRLELVKDKASKVLELLQHWFKSVKGSETDMLADFRHLWEYGEKLSGKVFDDRVMGKLKSTFQSQNAIKKRTEKMQERLVMKAFVRQGQKGKLFPPPVKYEVALTVPSPVPQISTRPWNLCESIGKPQEGVSGIALQGTFKKEGRTWIHDGSDSRTMCAALDLAIKGVMLRVEGCSGKVAREDAEEKRMHPGGQNKALTIGEFAEQFPKNNYVQLWNKAKLAKREEVDEISIAIGLRSLLGKPRDMLEPLKAKLSEAMKPSRMLNPEKVKDDKATSSVAWNVAKSVLMNAAKTYLAKLVGLNSTFGITDAVKSVARTVGTEVAKVAAKKVEQAVQKMAHELLNAMTEFLHMKEYRVIDVELKFVKTGDDGGWTPVFAVYYRNIVDAGFDFQVPGVIEVDGHIQKTDRYDLSPIFSEIYHAWMDTDNEGIYKMCIGCLEQDPGRSVYCYSESGKGSCKKGTGCTQGLLPIYDSMDCSRVGDDAEGGVS